MTSGKSKLLFMVGLPAIALITLCLAIPPSTRQATGLSVYSSGLSARDVSAPPPPGLSARDVSAPPPPGLSARDVSAPPPPGLSARDVSAPPPPGFAV